MTRASTWNDTMQLLSQELISDILVTGLIRDGGPPRVAGLTFYEVYFVLRHGYLEFASVNGLGGLRARHVDAMDLQPYLDTFEPEEVLSVSLAPLFFGETPEDVECLAVNYVTNEESDVDQGIVRCAELVLSTGQRIFLDPMYTSGIRIGNAGDWMREYETQPWTWQRHTWTRP
jgi:hypothetical protein